MTQGIQNGLSGIQANQRRVAASAHNTANQTTDSFDRQRVTAQERQTGGVNTRVDKVELSDEAQERAQEVDGPQNNVDPVSETVDRITARENFRSNARVIRAQDEILDALLDLEA